MQYIREDRSGRRLPVKDFEWLADKMTRQYDQIHAYESVIIYRMK